jgi:UPF0042 nucleotide-binding protein
MDNANQDVIIVSGMSGGGKSTALNALEDLGYYCIDNLPGAMLPGFQPLIPANPELYKKVALGIDARSRESDLQIVIDWMRSLREAGFNCRLLFITAEKPVLIKRFSETRRRHPLTGSDKVLTDAIENEARLLEPLSRWSDLVIDSSHTNIHQLRRQVWNFVDRRSSDMTIVLQSFAYKKGVPQDADFIFDARILPNPHWQDDLRKLTGRDKAVRTWLERDRQVLKMSKDIEDFMHTWLPEFQEAQRNYVTICIGCTGGKHRSVFLAERLAKSIGKSHENVLVHHREKPFWNEP